MGSWTRNARRALLTAALLAAAAAGSRPASAQSQPAPVTAGYDKGFFIKSDNFEVHIGTRTQLLFSSTQPDTYIFDSLLGKKEDTKNDNELNIRRFKFFMTGFVYKPSVKFKMQFDVERFKAGGGSAGNVRLEEAYVDLTEKPWTQLRVGQFKVPFTYEKMTSSGKLNLVDRSIVHNFFGINQEPGVNLYGQSFDKKFKYDVAVTTGVSDNKGWDTLNDIAANGKSDFRYMARVTWEPLDPYVWEQGAVSNPDKSQLTLQLGFMSNRTTIPLDGDPFLPAGRILPFKRDVLGANSADFDAGTDGLANVTLSQSRKAYDRNELEFVAAYKYKGFYVEGQAIGGNVDPEKKYIRAANPDVHDITFDNTGFRLQTGIFVIPTRLEFAGRIAEVDREAKAKFESNPTVKEEIDQTEYRLGLNWYFSKHDWKWQFDIGQINTEWKLNGHKLAEPDRGDFPGGVGFDDKVIQHNERKDKEFRTQFQLQF